MSRMTSAQIIGQGEYLNSDFEPSSLTVSQLLGVLGFHNITYPTPYTKPKLVQLFNDEIKAKSGKLRRERLKKENSIASDDGITDGLTGQPIGGRKAAPVRRSSRRLSRQATEDQEQPIRPDPPKRRRSSAQPSFGGPTRRITSIQSTVAEESEPEEDELPVRKVGRSKKSSDAAGSQGRRVSQPATEDSGWEDNNIFQSGAESSSPLRPSPVRPKASRKSAVPRKSRKSTSAPPQLHPPSSPIRSIHEDVTPRSPPQSNFKPQLPASVTRETRLIGSQAKHTSFIPLEHHRETDHKQEDSEDELNLQGGTADNSFTETSAFEENLPEAIGEEPTDDDEKEHDTPAQSDSALTRRYPTPGETRPIPPLSRILFIFLVIASLGAVVNFKLESARIGFCDTGSNTNNALEELKSKWEAVEACNKENRTLLYLPPLSSNSSRMPENTDNMAAVTEVPCPLPPLVPVPHPTTCTPCPDHATCTQHSVTCNNGYLLRPHPLLFFLRPVHAPSTAPFSLSSSPVDLAWKAISTLTDGLPWLGSVGFPHRCVEDPKRKRNIGVLGKAIESVLGQERGRRLCAGEVREELPSGSEEAKRWGIELEILRDVMKKKTAPHLLATFDDTFSEAIQQLIQWGGVIISEDAEGKRYLAHTAPNLTWNCTLTVKSREVWKEWRMTLLGIAMAIIGVYIARARRAQLLVENKRIAELVQIALDTLRNQELAHHTDPVTVPQPYLSSLQLRDLILQDEHSIATRRRLWDRVERVVEGNVNVRANMEEVHGGDEMRVWRWVGSSGNSPGVRRRVKFNEKEGEA